MCVIIAIGGTLEYNLFGSRFIVTSVIVLKNSRQSAKLSLLTLLMLLH